MGEHLHGKAQICQAPEHRLGPMDHVQLILMMEAAPPMAQVVELQPGNQGQEHRLWIIAWVPGLLPMVLETLGPLALRHQLMALRPQRLQQVETTPGATLLA